MATRDSRSLNLLRAYAFDWTWIKKDQGKKRKIKKKQSEISKCFSAEPGKIILQLRRTQWNYNSTNLMGSLRFSPMYINYSTRVACLMHFSHPSLPKLERDNQLFETMYG